VSAEEIAARLERLEQHTGVDVERDGLALAVDPAGIGEAHAHQSHRVDPLMSREKWRAQARL